MRSVTSLQAFLSTRWRRRLYFPLTVCFRLKNQKEVQNPTQIRLLLALLPPPFVPTSISTWDGGELRKRTLVRSLPIRRWPERKVSRQEWTGRRKLTVAEPGANVNSQRSLPTKLSCPEPAENPNLDPSQLFLLYGSFWKSFFGFKGLGMDLGFIACDVSIAGSGARSKFNSPTLLNYVICPVPMRRTEWWTSLAKEREGKINWIGKRSGERWKTINTKQLK